MKEKMIMMLKERYPDLREEQIEAVIDSVYQLSLIVYQIESNGIR